MHPPALECECYTNYFPPARPSLSCAACRSLFVGDSDSTTCYIRTTRLSRVVQDQHYCIHSTGVQTRARQIHRQPSAAVACQLLCCPATSVSSVRLFTKAGDMITKKRNSLKPAKTHQVVFLMENLETCSNRQCRYLQEI